MTKAQNRKIAVLRWLEKIRVSESHRFAGSPCWEWVGCIHPVTGYGQFKYDNRLSNPHRFAYSYFIGPIPAGYEVDHLCRVRHCCNPMHLETVTVQENRRRRSMHKTHCKRGHPFTPDNTYLRNGTTRFCRQCNAIRQKAHRERLKLSNLFN